MRQYFAYIRVSTQKQGEKGSSLQEQRAAIEAFAQREQIGIVEWFEERETAAKQGRTVFRRMFAALEKGAAHGVVMHKIDRGARNLSDWADLARLLDKGIEVRFANENLDMQSRGGRLAADIQAVVAADYIRNLRDEVKKGLTGRLKQGYFPSCAPIGYLNNGSATPKTICPVKGPLVRTAYELYATGNYSLHSLKAELDRLGLKSRSGTPMSIASIEWMLKNPFYYGIIHIKKNNQTYQGNHKPLITKTLFDRVQETMRRPIKVATANRRSYVLQRKMRCTACTRGLYAETQKGIIYYRCHTRSCHGVSIREEIALRAIAHACTRIALDEQTLAELNGELRSVLDRLCDAAHEEQKSLALQLAQVRDRETRLTDAYLEEAIDRDTYETRKGTLIQERVQIEQSRAQVAKRAEYEARACNFLELLKALQHIDKIENPAKIREILKNTISNLHLSGKNVDIAWDFPVSLLFFRGDFQVGRPKPDDYHKVWSREELREILRAAALGKFLYDLER